MKTLSVLLVSMMQMVAFSQEWIESYKDESISIEFSKTIFESPSDGINHERFIFRYTNFTNQNLNLKFNRKVVYDGIELPASDERSFEVNLPAKSTTSYTEQEKYNKVFYLFVSDINGIIKKKLTDFEIINIETK